jgi:hypothetical protein
MSNATNYGLNDSLEYYEFEFDSADTSDTPDAANSTLNWPLFLLGRPLTNVAAIKILEVQIPFSYYVFNSQNNTFVLIDNSGTYTITIPVGNYSATAMATQLGTLLSAASGNTYTVTYNSLTNTLTYSVPSASTTTFSLTFGSAPNNGSLNPRIWLGMSAGVTASTTSGSNQVINSTSVLISGPNYLYVNSVNFGSQCQLYLPDGPFTTGTIGPQVAKVPVNCNSFQTIFWQDPDPLKWFDLDSLSNFAKIDFFLTMGNIPLPLDLNGLSFSLKLGLLVNRRNHNSDLSGLKSQDRVVKRARFQ